MRKLYIGPDVGWRTELRLLSISQHVEPQPRHCAHARPLPPLRAGRTIGNAISRAIRRTFARRVGAHERGRVARGGRSGRREVAGWTAHLRIAQCVRCREVDGRRLGVADEWLVGMCACECVPWAWRRSWRRAAERRAGRARAPEASPPPSPALRMVVVMLVAAMMSVAASMTRHLRTLCVPRRVELLPLGQRLGLRVIGRPDRENSKLALVCDTSTRTLYCSANVGTQ